MHFIGKKLLRPVESPTNFKSNISMCYEILNRANRRDVLWLSLTLYAILCMSTSLNIRKMNVSDYSNHVMTKSYQICFFVYKNQQGIPGGGFPKVL